MHDHVTLVAHPLGQPKRSIMRYKETSTGQFRQLLREISQFLAYEITRELPLENQAIETPMGPMDAPMLRGKKLALISILRAGNGLLDGVLELVPSARVGFVGLYRDEQTLEPVEYYFKVPDVLNERLVIAVDPMLATGNSSVAAIDRLKEAGATNIRVMCMLAAPGGIARTRPARQDVNIAPASADVKLDEPG